MNILPKLYDRDIIDGTPGTSIVQRYEMKNLPQKTPMQRELKKALFDTDIRELDTHIQLNSAKKIQQLELPTLQRDYPNTSPMTDYYARPIAINDDYVAFIPQAEGISDSGDHVVFLPHDQKRNKTREYKLPVVSRSIEWLNRDTVIIGASSGGSLNGKQNAIIYTLNPHTTCHSAAIPLEANAFEEQINKITVIKTLSPQTYICGFKSSMLCKMDTRKKTPAYRLLVNNIPPVNTEKNAICSIAPSSGNYIAIGLNSGKVVLCDTRKMTRDLKVIFQNTSGAGIRALSWKPNSTSTLVFGGGYTDRTVYLYDMHQQKVTDRHSFRHSITDIQFIDSKIFAATLGALNSEQKTQNYLHFFEANADTLQHKADMPGDTSPIRNGVFNKENQLLATSSDANIKVWDFKKKTKSLSKIFDQMTLR